MFKRTEYLAKSLLPRGIQKYPVGCTFQGFPVDKLSQTLCCWLGKAETQTSVCLPRNIPLNANIKLSIMWPYVRYSKNFDNGIAAFQIVLYPVTRVQETPLPAHSMIWIQIQGSFCNRKWCLPVLPGSVYAEENYSIHSSLANIWTSVSWELDRVWNVPNMILRLQVFRNGRVPHTAAYANASSGSLSHKLPRNHVLRWTSLNWVQEASNLCRTCERSSGHTNPNARLSSGHEFVISWAPSVQRKRQKRFLCFVLFIPLLLERIESTVRNYILYFAFK